MVAATGAGSTVRCRYFFSFARAARMIMSICREEMASVPFRLDSCPSTRRTSGSGAASFTRCESLPKMARARRDETTIASFLPVVRIRELSASIIGNVQLHRKWNVEMPIIRPRYEPERCFFMRLRRLRCSCSSHEIDLNGIIANDKDQ